MRACEIILDEDTGRKQPISLRWLHDQKVADCARMLSHKKRVKLLPIMYAKEDHHETRLKQIELEKQELELKRLQAEYDQTVTEPIAKSFEAIKRLSRDAMRRQKKA